MSTISAMTKDTYTMYKMAQGDSQSTTAAQKAASKTEDDSAKSSAQSKSYATAAANVSSLSNLVDSYSAKQAEVVFYKLHGYKEIEISERLGIYQSSVNMRSSQAQWGLLSTALRDFEEMDFERLCG